MNESVVNNNATSTSTSYLWGTFDIAVMGQSITVAQHFYRTSVFTVGMLANYLVMLVTAFSRQLRQPRHLFSAATSLFEFIFLLNSALELIAVKNRDELACRFWVLFYPVDDSVLMLCHFLATVDRYLALTKYEWYKEKVTNRRVILLILTAFALSFFIITRPFWTGYKSIYTCTLNLTRLLSVQAWNFLLGVVCVVLHFKIFYVSKTLVIRHYSSKYRCEASVKFVKCAQSAAFPPADQPISGQRLESTTGVIITFNEPSGANRNGNGTVPVNSQQLPSSSMMQQEEDKSDGCFPCCWKPKRSKTKRHIQIEAALNLLINILPFFFFTFPISCYVFSVYWCVCMENDCVVVYLAWTYVWDVFILHSVYNPIIYMATCSEFHRALCDIKNKLANLISPDINGNSSLM